MRRDASFEAHANAGVGGIWVNRRTPGDVRATVRSLLAQAEYLGEIVLGLALGVIAQTTGIPTSLLAAAALVTGVGVLVMRARGDRAAAAHGA